MYSNPSTTSVTDDASVTISVKGRKLHVPAVIAHDRTLVIRGRWLKTAVFHDEEWQESGRVDRPEAFVGALQALVRVPDLFAFAEPEPELQPRFSCRVEWDNLAVVPITTFDNWWERRVPQETRKNVRRSLRRGVTVGLATLNEAFARGIKRIYDETPVRQGRRFWHYGKELPTVIEENASYLDRCDFVAAYHGDDLIGFLKMVYVGTTARIMQILSMNAHFDKRPTNALLAKAIERCCERGVSWFVYGKYIYGRKADSPVTEFKRRNGFEEFRFPRYYFPVTRLGSIALRANLHRGVQQFIPESVASQVRALRSRLYYMRSANTIKGTAE